ncbi:uncharacterized protein LOC108151495 [Drosophila miranda]|uniref:uncharacterized protein LOC108151495 n=1 Tax=Drosophila miranda TaxID=7229 RepID=UPI0007E81041|nr:uncharacterized protein LOC108151495 [Drosophila miranda]
MCLFLNLVLLVLAVCFTEAQTSRREQAPIAECPGRSVPQVRAGASDFEIAMIFHYVSWSSEAKQAKTLYDGLAHYYHEYAFFGAVDCWHFQCNCSSTHVPNPGVVGAGGYPDKWPTLIVRYNQRNILQYSGEWNFEDLARFMNYLIEPVDRVHTSLELAGLRKHSDAVVLALLDSADSLAYKRYIAAAICWLEFDPERNIRFALNFGKSAKSMLKGEDVTLPQLVVIDSRNGVHTFNTSSSDWRALGIVRWVRHTLKSLVFFSNGYGTPTTIALKARYTPVLAMGVRMHQSHQSAMPMVMVKEMASELKKQTDSCDSYWAKDDSHANVDSLLQMPAELYEKTSEDREQRGKQCYRAWQLNAATLANYYRINKYLNYVWLHYTHQNHLELSAGRGTESQSLLALHRRNLCLAHSNHGSPAMKIGIANMVTKYSQLIWKNSGEDFPKNRSLGVVIFDSIKYGDYLQQLGIQQHQHHHPHERDASAVQVFILDMAEEALHVMPQDRPFSYVALKDFIRQFYAKTLPKVYKNALPPPDTAFHRYFNRQMLLQALQRPNATNVVFMYRPDCALSAVLSQAFLQVSALLTSPSVNFIRFDSQANDLPWEFSMPLCPSLLVFPEARPTESVVFPNYVRIDVKNVFAFVIAQLDPEQQLRSVLASCRRRMKHVRSCLDFARSLVLKHVGQYLKYWEIYEHERDQILSHLKEFNDMHLAIDRSIRL